MKMRIARPDSNGLADQLDGQRSLTGNMCQYTQQMHRLRMPRKLTQNLPKDGIRLRQLPAINLLRSELQGLGNGKVLSLGWRMR